MMCYILYIFYIIYVIYYSLHGKCKMLSLHFKYLRLVDRNIFRPVNSFDVCTQLQSDIDSIQSWCAANLCFSVFVNLEPLPSSRRLSVL